MISEVNVPQVVVFDTDGSVVDSLASRGQGPGEFQRPLRAGFVGDTLWVIDGRQYRVTYMHDGEVVDTEPLRSYTGLHPDRNGEVVGILPGRVPVVHTSRHINESAAMEPESPGLVGIDAASGFIEVGRVNADYVVGVFVHRRGGRIQTMSPTSQPYSPAAHVTPLADGSGIVIATGNDRGYTLHVVDAVGDTTRTVVRDADPIAITAEMADAIIQDLVREPFTPEEVREALFMPETYPPVSDLIAAADGSIWVRRERIHGEAPKWDVHDLAGTVTSVAAPRGFDLRAPTAHGVWGIETDAFDVPYLVRRPLVAN